MRATTRRGCSAAFATALILVTSQVASAHPGHGAGTGFGAGLAHPVSGMDHVLAMIAVGLLAAHLGGRSLWLLPLTFVGLMLSGGLLALAGLPLPMVEHGIATSVVVLGVLIAVASRAPAGAAVSLVGAFAVFHGYAHVAEAGTTHSLPLYAAGFVLATALLHGVGIAARFGARRFAPPLAWRVGGATIAACGGLMSLHLM